MGSGTNCFKSNTKYIKKGKIMSDLYQKEKETRNSNSIKHPYIPWPEFFSRLDVEKEALLGHDYECDRIICLLQNGYFRKNTYPEDK